jgi:hypothetical protein
LSASPADQGIVSKRLGSRYRSGAGRAARGGGGLGTIEGAAVADDTNPKKPFANTDEFYHKLGLFYFAWSRTDLVIDCAVWKASEPAPEVHEQIAPMNFARKCKHFRSLLPTSKFKDIEKVEKLLTRIPDHSMRNVFAHSFLASDIDSVTFIDRWQQGGGPYRVDWHPFTRDQFLNHVEDFIQLSLSISKGQWACRIGRWQASLRPRDL